MSNWSTFKLDEVSDFINGKAFYSDGYSEEGYRVIDLLNITRDGRFQLTKKDKYISKETYDKYPKVHLLKNDLLIIMTDITPDLILLGKTAIVPRNGYILNQRVGCIRIKDKFKEKISVKFLTNLINSDEVHHHFYKAAIGTAQYYFNTPDVKKCEISLPSLKVQNKIADIISSVDKVIELTEIDIEKLKNLKKGMMQDLLTRGTGHTKFKDSPIGKIPENWEYGKIGDLVTNKTKKNLSNSVMNLKYIALEHIESETFQLIGYDWSQSSSSANTLFESGDVLFGKLRPYLRKSVTPKFDGCCTGELLVLRTKSNKLSQHFLKYIFQQESIYQYCEGLVAGTKMPRVSWGDLKEFQVLLPKIDEQDKIVKAISSVDTQIDSKVKKYKTLIQLKKGLMQDLLTGKVRVKV